jgi:TolB-like protein/Tfp pilus assembly protein PilF/tRNA A-37 threonylcarbamoyl transferase component Bud32
MPTAASHLSLVSPIRFAPAPDQDALAVARTLLGDRYAVEREIGRGGMATVYLAEETKHSRQVAIKVLRPELAATLGAERFLREIGIAARLSHPHLVPLIDSGDAGGLLYYVSAYLAGGSLRDRLDREGKLPVRDALRIAEEVSTALDYAHRAGFVHRDVKPENILFADGHALLADFGVARVCCGDGEDPVTAAGIAIGTPEYMSPEQASGEREIDGRADIYALACVVYEMLTGAPPFRADSQRTVMVRHVTETPSRIRALHPEIPAQVDDAIARALAKDPSLRFGSACDFVSAMRVASAPRGRVFTGATRNIAVLPFVNASPDPDNEYLSDGITDELIDALAKVEGLRVASRTSVFALKGKPQDVRAIGALLDCPVVLEGTVRRAGQQLRITAQLTSTEDGHLVWSQRYDRPMADAFAIQDEIARTIVNTLRATSFADLAAPPLRRHTDNAAAYSLYLKGRFEWNRRTQEGIAAGIKFFEQAIAEDPRYALAYTGLADCYSLHVDYRSVPVVEGFEAAKAYARKAIELDDTLAEAHASLAWSLFIFDWNWAEAEREFRRAIELDPRYASAHQWYAFLLAAMGSVGEALVESHTAVELDPASASARRSLGTCYYYARRWDQAAYHFERGIAMNPNAEETYRMWGLTLAVAGRLDEAVPMLMETNDLPASGTYTRASLGYALARAGRHAEAQAIYDDLAARVAAGEYVSPVAFATILIGLGDADRALDWMERALDDRRGWLVYLNVNPLLDPLRGHPRFEELIRRMRLPSS